MSTIYNCDALLFSNNDEYIANSKVDIEIEIQYFFLSTKITYKKKRIEKIRGRKRRIWWGGEMENVNKQGHILLHREFFIKRIFNLEKKEKQRKKKIISFHI